MVPSTPPTATHEAVTGACYVRNSRDGDVPPMLAIYLHHILPRGGSPASMANSAPDAEDLMRRRRSMNNRKDAASGGGGGRARVLGCAYAVLFSPPPPFIAIRSNIRSTPPRIGSISESASSS